MLFIEQEIPRAVQGGAGSMLVELWHFVGYNIRVCYYGVEIVNQEVYSGKKDSEESAIDLKRSSRGAAKNLP